MFQKYKRNQDKSGQTDLFYFSLVDGAHKTMRHVHTEYSHTVAWFVSGLLHWWFSSLCDFWQKKKKHKTKRVHLLRLWMSVGTLILILYPEMNNRGREGWECIMQTHIQYTLDLIIKTNSWHSSINTRSLMKNTELASNQVVTL